MIVMRVAVVSEKKGRELGKVTYVYFTSLTNDISSRLAKPAPYLTYTFLSIPHMNEGATLSCLFICSIIII